MKIQVSFWPTRFHIQIHIALLLATAPGDDLVDLEDLLLALDAAVGRGPAAGARRGKGGGVAEPDWKWFADR